MFRRQSCPPFVTGETHLIASQALTPFLTAFGVYGNGDIPILPIYDWPFEGVPASLGPRLRTVRGANWRRGEMMRHRVPNGVITGELPQEAKNQARRCDRQRSEGLETLGRPKS